MGSDGSCSAARLKAALDEGVTTRRLRWAFGAEHPNAHSQFHLDGSTHTTGRRKEGGGDRSARLPWQTSRYRAAFHRCSQPCPSSAGLQGWGQARLQPGTAGAGARASTPKAGRGLHATHMLTVAQQSYGQMFLPTHGARVRAALLQGGLPPQGGAAPAVSPAAGDAPPPVQSELAAVWKRERWLPWAAWEQPRSGGSGHPVEGEGSRGAGTWQGGCPRAEPGAGEACDFPALLEPLG